MQLPKLRKVEAALRNFEKKGAQYDGKFLEETHICFCCVANFEHNEVNEAVKKRVKLLQKLSQDK